MVSASTLCILYLMTTYHNLLGVLAVGGFGAYCTAAMFTLRKLVGQ